MKKFLALLLMVSTLFGLSSCFSCEGGHGDEGDGGLAARFTDEELNSFNPDAPYKMYGNSRPIDIQPRPYLHITAGRGAFKEDVQIRVTDVTERTMEQLDEKISQEGRGELLFAYDIDAGLSPDKVIPGKYNVEFDLSKLGVPADIQPFMKVVRVASDGSIETLNSHVRGDKLSYAASQNSVVAIVCGLASNTFVAWLVWEGGNFAYRSWMAIKMNSNGSPWFDLLMPHLAIFKRLASKDDMVGIHVEDEFGNFNVMYRYSESERGDRYKEYIKKSRRLTKLVQDLHAEAERKFDKKHPGWKSKWFVTDGDKAQQRMETAQLFYDLMIKNKEVQDLAKDEDLQTPQSILDIIKGVKIGNRFCREKLGMKPLSHEFDVYVADSTIIGSSKSEALRTAPDGGCNPHLTVCYNYVVTKDSVTNKLNYTTEKYDAVVLTMTHEAFHLYQSEYITSNLFKDMRFFEATASVVEHQFGDWMKDKGYISYDPRSVEGGQKLGYTSRANHHLLGWTLTRTIPSVKGEDDLNIEGGYMLGDLLQFLLDKKGEVTFPDMMDRYAYNKTFSQSLMDIFGINTEGAFASLYEEFCQKHMADIVSKQSQYSANDGYKYMTLPGQKHDMDNCVMRIKRFGHVDAKTNIFMMADEWEERTKPGAQIAMPFAVKTFSLREWSVLTDTVMPKQKDAKGEKTKPQIKTTALKPHYALFAVPSKKLTPNMVKFTFLNGKNEFTSNAYYYNPCAEEYQRQVDAVLLFRPDANSVVINDEDYWLDIVALYEPALNPRIEGMSQDRKGLLIDTRDEPTIALEEHGYVSGMQLCVVNNKTKEKKNFNVPLRLCGEKVKLPYKSMGITDKNKVDVTIRSRWFYRTDDGKTTYYGAAGKPIHYTQNGTQKSQLEEDYPNVEPADAPEENVGEDGEEEGVLMEVTLKYPNVKHYEGRAKMVVTKDKFRIEIMSYNYTYFEKAPVAGMGDFPADLGENITKSGSSTVIEGKCQWFAYSADLSHVITRGHGGSGGTDDDAPTLTDTYPVITEVTSVLPWNEKQKTYQSGGNHAGDKVADSQYNYKFQRDRQRELEAAGPVFFLSEGGFVKGEKMQVEVAAEETYTSMHRTEPRVTDSKKKFSFQILHIDRKN